MSFSINRTGGVRPALSAVVLVLSVALTGCGGGTGSTGGAGPSAAGTEAPAAASGAAGTTQARPSRPSAGAGASAGADSARLPDLGPRTLAAIPGTARQVVLVTGRGRNSPVSEVTLYRRTDAGWEPGAEWPAHNALRGWTDDHHAGDLRSPIGVFALTDAGGLLADPGSKLPYDRSGGFSVTGTGLEGEPLAGSFDYVVAINYNREPGTSPRDWTRPLGAGRGGGIWLHVDHGGPTHGCVSLAQGHMKELLRTLDPAEHPVVVMGDAASLTR